MATVGEFLAGTAVEVVIFTVIGTFVYRSLAGRFLIPKKETVMPYQKGVLLRAGRPARVVNAGSCWVRPGTKLVLCDMRMRAIQTGAVEVLMGDNAVVRLNLSGEFVITEPDVFVEASGNAVDKLQIELTQTVKRLAREWTSIVLLQPGGDALFAGKLQSEMDHVLRPIGLKLSKCTVWDLYLRGFVTPAQPPPRQTQEGMVQ